MEMLVKEKEEQVSQLLEEGKTMVYVKQESRVYLGYWLTVCRQYFVSMHR
jgi:hypothetical protein